MLCPGRLLCRIPAHPKPDAHRCVAPLSPPWGCPIQASGTQRCQHGVGGRVCGASLLHPGRHVRPLSRLTLVGPRRRGLFRRQRWYSSGQATDCRCFMSPHRCRRPLGISATYPESWLCIRSVFDQEHVETVAMSRLARGSDRNEPACGMHHRCARLLLSAGCSPRPCIGPCHRVSVAGMRQNDIMPPATR